MSILPPFEFGTAGRTIFGSGSSKTVAGHIRRLLPHCTITSVFLVHGKDPSRSAFVREDLTKAGITVTSFAVAGEPTTENCLAAVKSARYAGCNAVVGIGGGSVVDLGKAVAALIANEGDPLDYLEVVGKGLPLKFPAVPYIAIPTTAGTGSEVTANSVLESPEHKQKCSIRSPFLIPAIAIIDPELTLTSPPTVTAYSGLDALTQCIEPYLSNKSNPFTDSLALEGIKRAGKSLRKAYENGSDLAAREDMCVCSLFGGIALANAKLGAVHGFAGPIGGMFDAPHGGICGRLLPLCMEANLAAFKQRDSSNPILGRMKIVAETLTGNPNATAEEGIEFLHSLVAALNVAPLSTYGISHNDIDAIVKKAQTASSMQGNPIKLTEAELAEILKKAI